MKFYDNLLWILLMFSNSILLHASVVDVTGFGARGDGVTDDHAAIQNAVAELKKHNGGILYFPVGQYRIATSGHGALFLDGISNATIRFEPGAVLLMDNLLPDGSGGGHGIVVRGPGSGITLENIHVRWVKKAIGRSHGDAFRFEGYPSDGKTIARIIMNNCIGERSPQTGAVFMGCSDVSVNNFSPIDTWADGLHFNACRRVNVNGVLGLNNGDDTLAFVTYFDEKFSGQTGGVFSFPDLNEWCNSDSNATNITAIGGHADGMRISGARNINVSNLNVSGKWAGVQLDSAIKTTENEAVGWGYPASRNINISNVSISDCDLGLIVRSLNVLPDASESFWSFKVNISNLTLSGIHSHGIDIQSVCGIQISNIRSDSRIRFLNLRGPVSLNGLDQTGGSVEFTGIQGKRFFGFRPNMEPKPIEVSGPEEVATGSVLLSRVNLTGAPLRLDRLAGLCISGLRSDSAIELKNCRDIYLNETVAADKPSIGNCRKIFFNGSELQ